MHIEKIWVVLFFALFGLVRLLASKAEESRNRKRDAQIGAPPPPLANPRRETDTDRMRKFLEALGQPPGAARPPNIQRRITPPPTPTMVNRPAIELRKAPDRRSVFNPLPPLTTQPPAVPAPSPVRLQTSPLPGPAAVNRSAVEIIPADLYLPKEMTPGVDETFRRLLASPASLRQAMILREVLGAPRALRPLEPAGSA